MFKTQQPAEKDELVEHRRFETPDDAIAGLSKCYMFYKNEPVYVRSIIDESHAEIQYENNNIEIININSRHFSMRTPFVGYVHDQDGRAHYENRKVERQWRRGFIDRVGIYRKSNIFDALKNRYPSIDENVTKYPTMLRAFHKFFAIEKNDSSSQHVIYFKDKLFGFYDPKKKRVSILPEYDNITYRKLIDDCIR